MLVWSIRNWLGKIQNAFLLKLKFWNLTFWNGHIIPYMLILLFSSFSVNRSIFKLQKWFCIKYASLINKKWIGKVSKRFFNRNKILEKNICFCHIQNYMNFQGHIRNYMAVLFQNFSFNKKAFWNFSNQFLIDQTSTFYTEPFL